MSKQFYENTYGKYAKQAEGLDKQKIRYQTIQGKHSRIVQDLYKKKKTDTKAFKTAARMMDTYANKRAKIDEKLHELRKKARQ